MNNKGHTCRQAGFTLIELVVVVGVLGIILVTMSTVLINSTRAKNRTAIIQNLDINGNRILDKIKYNLINADPTTIVCPVGPGSSVAFIDKMGVGDITTLSCSDVDGKVASASSARPDRQELNSDSVSVSGCGNFVNCNIVGGDVQAVNIKFNLKAGDASSPNAIDSINRDFETSVTVRQ
jgi:prepilin-type N-terminal cleavage/methylation domain-containing protein